MIDQYMTAHQVGERLQIHAETVLRLARAGELRGAKLVGQWRFSPADVEAYIQHNMNRSGVEEIPIPM